MASYGEALKLEPYHPDALSKLAALLEELGRQEEAIRLYEEGIRHAACLEFYVNLGALRIATRPRRPGGWPIAKRRSGLPRTARRRTSTWAWPARVGKRRRRRWPASARHWSCNRATPTFSGDLPHC